MARKQADSVPIPKEDPLDEALIMAVEQYPAIYNLNLKEYHTITKEQAWRLVSRNTGIESK